MTAFSQLFAFLFRSFRVDGGDSSSTAAGPLCRCVRVHLKNNETHILINSANDNFYLNFIYHKSWAPLPDDIFQNMLMKLIFQFCTFLRACVCPTARELASHIRTMIATCRRRHLVVAKWKCRFFFVSPSKWWQLTAKQLSLFLSLDEEKRRIFGWKFQICRCPGHWFRCSNRYPSIFNFEPFALRTWKHGLEEKWQ